MGASPAFAGPRCALLFVLALLRQDVCGRDGNDWGVFGAHPHRGDRRVRRQGGPVGALTRETVGAMDGLGGEGGRPIQGDQQLLPQDPETLEQMVLFKARTDLEKDGVAVMRGSRIEAGADRVVIGDGLDAQQGLGVLPSLAGLELALGLQKRGRWPAEDAQGASGSVLHRVTGIGAVLAMVRERRETLVEDRLEFIEASRVRQDGLLRNRGLST